jgi:hypothetical protein
MTAPSAISRTEPTGIKLSDGYQTTIAMNNLPAIAFWEKTVGFPAIDGGDGVDQTTMFNEAWMTQLPSTLKKGEPFDVLAAYDPRVATEVEAQCNINQNITITLPDGSTYSFYGWLKTFSPADLVRGTQPETTITFEVSNVDPITQGEEAPVMVEVAGT